MAEAISGVGVVWGLGSSLTATGTGIGTFLPQGADFEVDSEEATVQDYKGETKVEIFFDEKNMLRLEVVPSGSTIALARSANILPSPGAVVTVVDTIDTEIAGSSATAYLFISGSKRKSNKDVTKLNFVLKRFVANDVTATVAAS
jgi:hypothetical protein